MPGWLCDEAPTRYKNAHFFYSNVIQHLSRSSPDFRLSIFPSQPAVSSFSKFRMRPSTIAPLLGLVFFSPASALPRGDSCQRPPTVTVTSYIPEKPSSTFLPGDESTTHYSISTTETPIPEPTSLPPPNPEPTSNCRPTSWDRDGRAPSTGTLRAAVVFVDFPDFPATTTTDDLFANISSAPAELFKTMSYGKLNLELVPLLDQFYRMPDISSSYNYSRALTTEMHLKYINDALAAIPSSVSFRDIDVLYILPALDAAEISFSTSTGEDVTTPDGYTISSTITYGQDLYYSWGYKTINHETGHAMGLPDLYPYDGGAVPTYVGGFDLMGLIAGQSPDYLAWHKWQLEWINDEQVECVVDAGLTTHRISPIEVEGKGIKAIAIPLNETAYLLAEVRSNLGIDEEACGTGVLLYTADTNITRSSTSDQPPIMVIDTTPGSGGCAIDNGGELNDAPLKVGDSWDTQLGVVITIKEQDGDDYIVDVERWSR